MRKHVSNNNVLYAWCEAFKNCSNSTSEAQCFIQIVPSWEHRKAVLYNVNFFRQLSGPGFMGMLSNSIVICVTRKFLSSCLLLFCISVTSLHEPSVYWCLWRPLRAFRSIAAHMLTIVSLAAMFSLFSELSGLKCRLKIIGRSCGGEKAPRTKAFPPQDHLNGC